MRCIMPSLALMLTDDPYTATSSVLSHTLSTTFRAPSASFYCSLDDDGIFIALGYTCHPRTCTIAPSTTEHDPLSRATHATTRTHPRKLYTKKCRTIEPIAKSAKALWSRA